MAAGCHSGRSTAIGLPPGLSYRPQAGHRATRRYCHVRPSQESITGAPPPLSRWSANLAVGNLSRRPRGGFGLGCRQRVGKPPLSCVSTADAAQGSWGVGALIGWPMGNLSWTTADGAVGLARLASMADHAPATHPDRKNNAIEIRGLSSKAVTPSCSF